MSFKEAIVKVNEEDTDENARGYEEIAVDENADQMNNEVNEDILDDEVKNFAIDVKNSNALFDNQNKFIEAEVGRNVVKILFEGTFEKNSEEILENVDNFPKPEILL